MTWVNDCIVCPKTYQGCMDECYEAYEDRCDGTIGLCKQGKNVDWARQLSEKIEVDLGYIVNISLVLDLLQEHGIMSKEDRGFNDLEKLSRLIKDFYGSLQKIHL